jgi:hypothetical protein
MHVLLTLSLFGDGIPRKLFSARLTSETDFCSSAILMASHWMAPETTPWMRPETTAWP